MWWDLFSKTFQYQNSGCFSLYDVFVCVRVQENQRAEWNGLGVVILLLQQWKFWALLPSLLLDSAHYKAKLWFTAPSNQKRALLLCLSYVRRALAPGPRRWYRVLVSYRLVLRLADFTYKDDDDHKDQHHDDVHRRISPFWEAGLRARHDITRIGFSSSYIG